jgi:6-phosphogluconate dehydrogenase
MQLGLVGLGRMGGNMRERLRRAGHEVVGYDHHPEVSDVASMQELVDKLAAPRVVWVMVPAQVTEQTIDEVAQLLSSGDIVIDGGNSRFSDDPPRAERLGKRGIGYIDCGVSGGVWGLENGYALMFGGSPAAAREIEPLAKILAPAPDRGWLHCGPSGSGHFVKMIHNGIEYGMMQAFAEGFALLKGKPEFELDVAAIAEMWRHGSVVRSWLLDLTAEFLQDDAELEAVAPVVSDSGEGRWTAVEAIEQGVPAPVLSLALMMRLSSQGKGDYGGKLLAMMRKGFGGHKITSND